jgi:hypothetical protein
MAIEQRSKGGGLRAYDAFLVVAVGVIGVVFAFAALHFVAGLLWGVVKVFIVLALVGGALWYVFGRRGSSSRR